MRNKDDRLGDLEYPISPSSPTFPPQSSPTTPTQRTTTTTSTSSSLSSTLRSYMSSFCTHPLSICLSFVCPIQIQRWFLPGLEDHMNQTIQSLQNLRVLMDHGECVATMDCLYSGATSLSMEEDGVAPLLGGHMI